MALDVTRIGSFLRSNFRGSTRIATCFGAFVFLGAAPLANWFSLEKDKKALVDFGYGPGKPVGAPRHNTRLGRTPSIPKTASPTRTVETAVSALAEASSVGAGGFFGPSFPWPIIPIHVALLPDGRVLSFGTDQQGKQGAQFIYDVWDPKLGIGSEAHTILPNTTQTDIFCSAVSLLDGSGNALIVGGDLTVNGTRNYANDKVEIFSPTQNTLTASQAMQYPRWYPSITTLPNGDKLLLGGYISPTGGPATPEVRSALTGWRTLSAVRTEWGDWYYPKAFVGPDAATYFLQVNGIVSRINTSGTGKIANTGSRLLAALATHSATMLLDANNNPFSVLTMRAGKKAQVVDISKNPPVVTNVGDASYERLTGNLTLLPDGNVLASGGSAVFNDLASAAYQTEIYDRVTGTWTLGASASVPRLYHSSTLLLPDGSVLTAGGGAPGPYNELNAEIYYPPYLYLNDGSGNPAPRPEIVSAPTTTLTLGQNFSVTVGANDTIGRINLVRVGANTHNFNSEQRLIPVAFTQNGTLITASLKASPALAPPGYYMLFAFNTAGVPAVAKILSIGSSLPDLVPTSLTYSSATGTFTSVVTNRGTVPTPSGVALGVAYSADGVKCGWGLVAGPVAPGASVTVGTNGGQCAIASGTHSTSVLADDVNRVVESDETNNTFSQSITVGSPTLPDLVPTSLSYSSATGSFTSIVTNRGTGATPSGVSIGVAYSADGIKCGWGLVAGPVAPGASVTIGTNGGQCVVASGTHSASVLADDVNRVVESDETNNTFSQPITVGSPTLPDLVPTSLSYSSATGTFTSVVTNRGTGATPSGVAIGVAYSVDGTKCTWGLAQGSLAPGASVTIGTNGGQCAIASGTHTVAVVADDVNRVVESDKTNNTLSQSITVP